MSLMSIYYMLFVNDYDDKLSKHYARTVGQAAILSGDALKIASNLHFIFLNYKHFSQSNLPAFIRDYNQTTFSGKK